MKAIASERTVIINPLLFIILNILDVFITQWILVWDGREMFWWAASFNSNLIIKGSMALAIAFILVRFGQERILYYLNAAMVFVLFWNGMNLGSFLLSYFYWRLKIAF